MSVTLRPVRCTLMAVPRTRRVDVLGSRADELTLSTLVRLFTEWVTGLTIVDLTVADRADLRLCRGRCTVRAYRPGDAPLVAATARRRCLQPPMPTTTILR